MDCIFCKIAKGEIPCAKVYEDKDILAFLDIEPASKAGGHTLVIPKKHYESITDIPDALLSKAVKVVKKVGKALMIDSHGFNIVLNNKKAAGQLVPHAHFHIIPRNENDGLSLGSWISAKYADGEMEKIRSKLGSLVAEA